MCDILVALPDATADGATLFAKNSDRPAHDCQPLVRYPAQEHSAGSVIQLAYREAPQVAHTCTVLGFQPYWCWGFETGLNEHGVVAGNVALFTRELYRPENRREYGLLGMEMLRLGLERSRTAAEMVDVIVGLTETYGQWGSAVPGKNDGEGSYDNGFLIADAQEAWVLELAGRRWIARRITSGVYALSNQPSIRKEWDRASADLVDNAIEQGWWSVDRRDAFDFARAYGAHERYGRWRSHIRAMRSLDLLDEARDQIDESVLIAALSDHYEDTFLHGPMFDPSNPDFLTLCMHASPAGFTWGNTASSMVVALSDEPDTILRPWCSFLTPCTGVFLPYYLNAELPAAASRAGAAGLRLYKPAEAPGDTPASASAWWTFKQLLDWVNVDYHTRAPLVRSEWKRLSEEVSARLPAVEEEARQRMGAGESAEAARLLSQFMEENLSRALAVAQRFVAGELQPQMA